MLRAGARHPDAVASTSASTPTSDSATLYATLNEYLLLEPKFQPKLCLPNESKSGEVTTGARDGAAHVMRCLKVWYELPPDVLINAINLFDRFLTKMKVRPSHLPCITVSCVNIAIEEFAAQNHVKRNVSIEELVSISQSACTAGDVSRMSSVIMDKLGLSPGAARVTSLHWLRLFRQLLASHVEIPPACQESELEKLLEIAACDAVCANARTSELALVLLYHKLEPHLVEWSQCADMAENTYYMYEFARQVQQYCHVHLVEWSQCADMAENTYYMYEFARQVQQYCHMSDASLLAVKKLVRHVISQYEARSGQPQRQRLVWRLSERTLKVLRPTDRLTSLLPTIEEQHLTSDAHSATNRNRSGSESSESEETSDWPRSPVLPVYCDN